MWHFGALLGTGIRPGLTALRRRDRPALFADLLAGATIAAYLVPQVLAYAEVAGLPAVAGLWASVAALTAYAAFGSSRLLSVGPESTTAVMTLIAISPLTAGDPGRHAALSAALATLVGLLCLAGRVARLGFLAELLSRPVLIGYLAGIALIMIAGQLGGLAGIPVDGGTFVDDVTGVVGRLDRVHLPTLVLSAAVLAVLVVVAVVLPRLPGPLLAILLATAASAVLDLPRLGVAVVGATPPGLPSFAVPAVTAADLGALLLPALGVALVGYSDNMLTGRAFARGGQRVDADQELLALGASNIAAGVLQGFPVSSSGSRTAIGAAVGGRSQLASMVTVLVVIAVLLVGGPVLAAFPTAALGALVVYAAVRLVDWREFRRFARFRSTSPRSTRCSGCPSNCGSAASSWRWPAPSTSCSRISNAAASGRASARTGSSRPFPPRCRPSVSRRHVRRPESGVPRRARTGRRRVPSTPRRREASRDHLRVPAGRPRDRPARHRATAGVRGRHRGRR